MRTALAPTPSGSSLADLLDRWVGAGLLTAAQARSIADHEQAREHASTAAVGGPSIVVEALGYLGGVVMLVGATTLVSVFWQDIATALRLVLIGATAAALVGGGFAVPDRLGPAAVRLRSVLWAAGVVAAGAFFAVLSVEAVNRDEYHALVIVGPGAAAVAAPLWWLRRTWLQQLALFATAMITVDGVTLEATSGSTRWGGAALWAASVVWAMICHQRWVEPMSTGVINGALGATIGSQMMDNTLGIALGLVTAAGTLALALAARSLPWLAAAAVALLLTAPRAANEWFPGRLSAAFSLIVAGGGLVVAAIWVARRKARPAVP